MVFIFENAKTLSISQTSSCIKLLRSKLFDNIRHSAIAEDVKIDIQKDLNLKNIISVETFKKTLKIINGEYKGNRVHSFEELSHVF